MTIEECRANIGAAVVYAPSSGRREDGVITDVTRMYVFVRYDGDRHSKATAPGQLTLLSRVTA